MMKQYLMLVFWLLPLGVFAQSDNFRVEVATQGCMFYSDFKPYAFGGSLGYNITDRFFVNVKGEYAINMFKKDGVKSYDDCPVAGVNAGYTFLKSSLIDIDGRLGFGDNFRKSENWRYSYYDAGIYGHLGNSKVKPIIGLGVRYYDSRNSYSKDYTRFYVSIGFGLNY